MLLRHRRPFVSVCSIIGGLLSFLGLPVGSGRYLKTFLRAVELSGLALRPELLVPYDAFHSN